MRPQLYSGSIQRACAICGKAFKTSPCRVRAGTDKFCGRKCFGISKRRPHADPGWPRSGRVLDTSLPSRFWSKVEKTGECWWWLGSLSPNGYGSFHVSRRRVPAHRVAYAITHGTIPAGLFVCHHCDEPRCVRPDHLFLGSPADNLRDASQKGRMCAGERTWSSKLTDAIVIAQRARYRAGGVTIATIARECGVTKSAMTKALSGRRWAHLG